jgi:uncharacterized membrane protein HdeD (DUF308 family)
MATSDRIENFHEPMPLVHKAGTWFIFTAIAFIVLGTLAILEPFVAGLAISTLVGWLLVIGGVMHFVNTFRSESFWPGVWQFVVGLFYLAVGGYFLTHPVIALSALTLTLAFVLFFEAVMEVTGWWAMRHVNGSGWLLADAVITTFLAALIWMGWPSATVWAIGTLVGVKLMFSGFSRLMLGSTTRSFEKRFEQRFVE